MVLTRRTMVIADLAPQLESPSGLCLFATLTGLPCPTCGGTRAIRDLVVLDLESAVNHNLPVTMAVFAALLAVSVHWKRVLQLVRGPTPLTRAATGAAHALKHHPLVATGVYVAMWVWNVGRW
jgi:hypothetical protein